MTLASEDAEQPRPQPDTTVELATLILPSHAAERGLDQQDQVVLEATHETVENLHEHARIEAVVDLTALSDLVGVSEQEFIADLHMEAGAAAAATEPDEHHHRDEEEAERHKEKGETTAEVADEEQPLLKGHARTPTADRITLAADPFVGSLAEVLNTTTQQEPESQTQQQDETVVLAEATKTDDGDQHLCHDAFLLNVPNESGTGGGGGPSHDHFVLALPEIIVEASVAESTLTETSHHLPFVERALSLLPTTTHLPTDVVEVHLEAHQEPAAVVTAEESKEEQPTTVHLDLVVERQVPVIGYVILIAGLVALSSVGAALDLQQGPSPTLKTLWRQTATCMALAPLVLKSLRQEGLPHLTPPQWCMLPLAAAAYTYMTLAFVLALGWTTMANAFVLSNMTALVIIVGRVLLRLPVLPAEGLGAAIGFSGAAVCAQDASRNNNNIEADAGIVLESSCNSMLGNLIALSASFGTACYLIVAKDLRSHMDLFVFMFCIMLFGSWFLLVFMIVTGEEFTLGMHPMHGLWGWLNPAPDRLALELYMAVICNCLGTLGYIAVLKYFSAIVPATVMLMEPVVGTLLGSATGTTALPGLQTWIGNAVVAAGTFIVIYSGSSKTEKIDATEALRPSTDDASVVSIMKSPLIRKNPPTHASEKTHAKVVWDH